MIELIVAVLAVGAVIFGFYYKFKVQKGGCECGCSGCSDEKSKACAHKN